MPGSFEDAAEEIAHEGATGVADVEWSSRVGRDELDVDPQRPRRDHPTEGRPGGSRPVEGSLEEGRCEVDVEEAGRGNLDRADGRAQPERVARVGCGDRRRPGFAWPRYLAGELLRQDSGDLERSSTGRPGELEGQVTGQIAVLRLGGAIDLDCRCLAAIRNVRQVALGDRPAPRTLDRRADEGSDGRDMLGGRAHFAPFDGRLPGWAVRGAW